MASSVYKEEQKFPLWIYLLTLMPLIVILSLSFFFYSENYVDMMGLALIVTMAAANLLIYFAKLKTKIDEEGVHIKFSPFTNKKILWKDIESAEVVKYGFVGYGWRYSFKYGRVYNTSGNKGLFIVKKDKKKILVGTQKPVQLKKAIEPYINLLYV